MAGWTLQARHVFPITGRHFVVVWGELEGDEVRTGQMVVVATGDHQVEGRVEGIELHRLRNVPESWVGLQVGGPVAEVVEEGSEVRHLPAISPQHMNQLHP